VIYREEIATEVACLKRHDGPGVRRHPQTQMLVVAVVLMIAVAVAEYEVWSRTMGMPLFSRL
jgi:hypothetical protein